MDIDKAKTFTYFALRVIAGALFFAAGSGKLFGWFDGHVMPTGTQLWIGGVLETVGGALIVLGLGTRLTAFILSGEMAVAYWQFHAPKGIWPTQNEGLAAVIFCFLFLYMAAEGAGPWSVDAMIKPTKS